MQVVVSDGKNSEGRSFLTTDIGYGSARINTTGSISDSIRSE